MIGNYALIAVILFICVLATVYSIRESPAKEVHEPLREISLSYFSLAYPLGPFFSISFSFLGKNGQNTMLAHPPLGLAPPPPPPRLERPGSSTDFCFVTERHYCKNMLSCRAILSVAKIYYLSNLLLNYLGSSFQHMHPVVLQTFFQCVVHFGSLWKVNISNISFTNSIGYLFTSKKSLVDLNFHVIINNNLMLFGICREWFPLGIHY